MRMRKSVLLACAALTALPLAAQTTRVATPLYDRVILGGRVINPASKLDAIRNVGINGDRIAAVTAGRIRGRDTIDARGLVVAPGFIDLHAHGQNAESYRYYVMDGVTTALEMELGVWPVARFYDRREGKSLVNFGGTVSHEDTREIATALEANGASDTAVAKNRTTQAILDTIRAALTRGLDEGGLGIGMGIAYTPGASQLEIYRNFQLCAERKVVCFTHARLGGLAGLQEVIANALGTGASLQYVHINSMGGSQVRLMLDIIRRARAAGVDVTTETYPYNRAQNGIRAAQYDSMEAYVARGLLRYEDMIWGATGEHLTAETFKKYRAEGGIVIQAPGPDSVLRIPLADPTVMIVSDGIAYNNRRGHPRLAGTYARVLGYYVREERVLTLRDAIRRMTYLPAKRMEASVPQFRKKGRLAVGMDADVTVFDAARVIDRATYEEPAQYSAGIVHVLVNGVSVVRNEQLVDSVAPGRAIRRPLRLTQAVPQ